MSQAMPQVHISGSRLHTGNPMASELFILNKTDSCLATGLLGGPSRTAGNALKLTDVAASFLKFLIQTEGATHTYFLDSEIMFI